MGIAILAFLLGINTRLKKNRDVTYQKFPAPLGPRALVLLKRQY